jgi:hypothetical protein
VGLPIITVRIEDNFGSAMAPILANTGYLVSIAQAKEEPHHPTARGAMASADDTCLGPRDGIYPSTRNDTLLSSSLGTAPASAITVADGLLRAGISRLGKGLA